MHCQRNANNRQTGGFQIPSKLVSLNSWIVKIVKAVNSRLYQIYDQENRNPEAIHY